MKTNDKVLLCLLLVALILGCKMLSKLKAGPGTEYKVHIEATDEDKEAIIERAIKVTENKLNAVGRSGEVRRDESDPNMIVVRVYGTEDPERMKAFLFTAYQLELRKVISPPNPYPVQKFPNVEAAQQAASGDQEILPYGERLGGPEQFVIVDKSVIINGEEIRDASAVSISRSQSDYTIAFSLKSEGAVKFGDWTGKNINNYLAVVLDKRIQSIAYIKSQIFDQGEISGHFTKASAEDIALSLKSGYLPAAMTVLEEKPFEK
jgi:protein-export membrane protein SecD